MRSGTTPAVLPSTSGGCRRREARPNGCPSARSPAPKQQPSLPEIRSQAPLQVVPAGWWHAARSRGPWSLLHCCVGPGFAFEDFRLMADLPPAERPAGADPAWL